jgi:hypothetical protein
MTALPSRRAAHRRAAAVPRQRARDPTPWSQTEPHAWCLRCNTRPLLVCADAIVVASRPWVLTLRGRERPPRLVPPVQGPTAPTSRSPTGSTLTNGHGRVGARRSLELTLVSHDRDRNRIRRVAGRTGTLVIMLWHSVIKRIVRTEPRPLRGGRPPGRCPRLAARRECRESLCR